MGIACSVLEAVEKEMRSYPDQRATKIALRIGEFAGVDADSLRFCFECITASPGAGRLELEIAWCRTSEGCRGDELELDYLETESLCSREDAGAKEVMVESGCDREARTQRE